MNDRGPKAIADPLPWLEPLALHFGFELIQLANYAFYRHSRAYIAIAAAAHLPPPGLASEGTGLRFLRIAMKVPRLTNAGARILAPLASRQLVELPDALLEHYLCAEKQIPVPDERLASCPTAGQVIVRDTEGLCLGVGHLHRGGERALLESFFPRRWMPASRVDAFLRRRERDRRGA